MNPMEIGVPDGCSVSCTVLSSLNVGLFMFGRPFNWSLKTNPEAVKRVAVIASGFGIENVFAPRPDFSARICYRQELWDGPSESFGGTTILRGKEGVTADGVEIKPGEAFFLGSADCPTLVVCDTSSGRIVCAHAGRDCLWDRKKVLDGAPSIRNESVVDAAVNYLDVPAKHLRAFIFGGISAENFEHRCDGRTTQSDTNSRMCGYFTNYCPTALSGDVSAGRLSLRNIIKAQLEIVGFAPDSIACDNIDTFSDKNPKNGELSWWSNRRGDKNERNGVLVFNASDD